MWILLFKNFNAAVTVSCGHFCIKAHTLFFFFAFFVRLLLPNIVVKFLSDFVFWLVAGCCHSQNRVGELSWLSSSLKSNFITIGNPEHVCESQTSSQQEQENLPPLQNLKVKTTRKNMFFLQVVPSKGNHFEIKQSKVDNLREFLWVSLKPL